MKYDIHFDTIGFYPYREWFYYFRKYKFIKGFNMRIFGICINIKEENSLNKLIAIGRKHNTDKNKIVLSENN